MTTVCVIQARHTSTRLPGKMILPLCDVPVIEHIINRARSVADIDRICVTIPEGDAQAPLADFLARFRDVHISRGPEEHLLTRFAIAADETGADVIVRLWGDCPAIDPAVIRQLLGTFSEEGTDWAYLSGKSGYPLGYECQAIRAAALQSANREAVDLADLEYLHSYFDRFPERFSKSDIRRPGFTGDTTNPLQMLLDTHEDYRNLQTIFATLYPDNPMFGLSEVEVLAAKEPSLFAASS